VIGEHIEFVELVFPMTAAFGMDERMEIEETLHSKLSAQGVGEVSGAGAGMGLLNLDVDVAEVWQRRPEALRQIIVGVLKQFSFPSGSTVRLYPLSDEKIMLTTRTT
jgi:hypothetical protein